MGQVRLIIPRVTACFDCTLNLNAPPRMIQLCTMASIPRKPEHCIAWAMQLEWPKHFRTLIASTSPLSPLPSADRKYDTDSPDDMQWLNARAEERAKQFGIEGVNYSNTLVRVMVTSK